MLRINLIDENDDEVLARRERMKEAEYRRQAANETMEEAWKRILSSKLSPSEREKLLEVKKAMDAGLIKRDPSAAFYKSGRPKRFSKAEALRMWRELEDMHREERIREIVRNTPKNYFLVQTEGQLKQVLSDIENEEIIALDTETTGLDVYRDRLVGMSLTLPRAGYHVYIPVGHNTTKPQLSLGYILEQMEPVLTNPNLKKVLHNAKFDTHLLRSYGIRLRGIEWDTKVAMHILNENEESFSLKDLATKYLKEPSDTFERLFGKTKFSDVPLDVALVYAAKDTDLTWRLYQFQLHHLRKQPKLLKLCEKLENPLVNTVIDMEGTGLLFDKKQAKVVDQQLESEIVQLENQLREHFGDINFNSPAQLSAIFYDQLKLDRYLPDDADRRTDVKTLKLLAPHHPGIKVLLEYREKSKLLTTYVRALPELVSPDGLIHGTFDQAGTVTGRFASYSPNLQNLPPYVRRLFVAPPGKLLLTADFSQQEPRMLAHFTQEPLLVETYKAGRDLYTTMAAELFGLPESECGDGSKYRKMVKVAVLAVMYSVGTKTLASQLEISEAEAEDFIFTFYSKYPRVKKWMDENLRFARRHGYVELLFGRKRRLPGIRSRDPRERRKSERQVTNSRIQGSSAIQTKIAMLKLYGLCKEKGADWNLALTVHDEIGLYVPETIPPDEVRLIEDTILNAVPLRVPSKVDIEIQKRWSESVVWNREKMVWTKKIKKGDVTISIGEYTSATEALAAYERSKSLISAEEW